jgi:multicomponent Na+:H+ antiporter subunit D
MSMTINAWLPILVLLTSLVTGIVIFLLRKDQDRIRYILNMFGATAKLVLVGGMIWGYMNGEAYESRIPLIPGIDLLFVVSPLSLAFASLSAVLWFLTTVYAIGYFEGASQQNRFFGFFSLCVTATMGITLAGNPITFFIFYEILTLVTYPLVVHSGTEKATQAGRTYLIYTLSAGTLMLFGIIWLHVIAGPVEFQSGGSVGVLTHVVERQAELTVIFTLIAIGLAVKAAMVPLHIWLPGAMVAPAPVSALLHAVAVVKAGAYGFLRFIHDLFGVPLASSLNVLTPLAIVASITIIYGSLRALTQQEIKPRLAYSTVSQVSYIVLGAAILGPFATIAAITHLTHQGIMKITLFFCAGIFAETLGIHDVKGMSGVGRRMPLTMTAFTIGGLGMIGTPPVAGFVTKWYLGTGALAAGMTWVIPVLIASTLLNAAYFLPPIYAGWFGKPSPDWEEKMPPMRAETRPSLLLPALVTASAAVFAGLMAASPLSPLELSTQIANELYVLWEGELP